MWRPARSPERPSFPAEVAPVADEPSVAEERAVGPEHDPLPEPVVRDPDDRSVPHLGVLVDHLLQDGEGESGQAASSIASV